MTNNEQRSQYELFQLMEIYKQGMDPGSEQNRFRGCLYNKLGKNVGVAHRRALHE